MERLQILVRNMAVWTKEYIRKQVEDARHRLGECWEEEQERNQRLLEKAREQKEFAEADEIYLYASHRHEAGTMELAAMWLKEGKRLAFPRVEGQEIYFYWVDSLDDLECGYRGILEPQKGCTRAENGFAPVLVPGVAFDWQGGRIGYGGGYYDRFFERENEHKKIGYAFAFQVYEKVPLQEHDIKMDLLVTEDRQAVKIEKK